LYKLNTFFDTEGLWLLLNRDIEGFRMLLEYLLIFQAFTQAFVTKRIMLMNVMMMTMIVHKCFSLTALGTLPSQHLYYYSPFKMVTKMKSDYIGVCQNPEQIPGLTDSKHMALSIAKYHHPKGQSEKLSSHPKCR
jgi:hypothetical protein